LCLDNTQHRTAEGVKIMQHSVLFQNFLHKIYSTLHRKLGNPILTIVLKWKSRIM